MTINTLKMILSPWNALAFYILKPRFLKKAKKNNDLKSLEKYKKYSLLTYINSENVFFILGQIVLVWLSLFYSIMENYYLPFIFFISLFTLVGGFMRVTEFFDDKIIS